MDLREDVHQVRDDSHNARPIDRLIDYLLLQGSRIAPLKLVPETNEREEQWEYMLARTPW